MSMIRLYLPIQLSSDRIVELPKEQAHYLANVMRKKTGDEIAVFNGKDGQWQAHIADISKRNCSLTIAGQTKKQKPEPDLWLCFAPVKNAPLAFIAQKATELGIAKLIPVITGHTITSKVNTDRLRANVIEASEQCERLTIPQVEEPIKLEHLLSKWDSSRKLILCDESGGGKPYKTALADEKEQKHAILIGPEGGFAQSEFENLRKQPYIIPVGMGPRILRADTAALAAITCYMSLLGDWDEQPRFKQE